jgi:hypothetical protein
MRAIEYSIYEYSIIEYSWKASPSYQPVSSLFDVAGESFHPSPATSFSITRSATPKVVDKSWVVDDIDRHDEVVLLEMLDEQAGRRYNRGWCSSAQVRLGCSTDNNYIQDFCSTSHKTPLTWSRLQVIHCF